MKNTLLIVFIHGFKGTDDTFGNFPNDLRALLAHTLPKIDIVSVQYPQYETRGDLNECVARFKEWLQNKVIDIEVANETPSPTVDPSVRVVLCGHSMGGIVAAETLLSIAKEQPLPPASTYSNDTTNSTTQSTSSYSPSPNNLAPPDPEDRPSSAPPMGHSRLLFPYIQAVIAFDTPYLGISPGVLAHGAEEHINQASSAYKAFDSASTFFGWNSPKSATPQPIPDAANRGLPASSGSGSSSWNKWGKYAAIGGAAAAIAGAAGAAYVNRNQISKGFTWAGSHLEFVGCLARGAELQTRVENVVQLTKSHGVGFADFYTALGEKFTNETSHSGSLFGGSRTFCVVPKGTQEPKSLTETRRDAPRQSRREHQASRSQQPSSEPSLLNEEMHNGEQVHEFAEDATKSKGHWVKCVNDAATDELKAHTSMFMPKTNPHYHTMLPMARDEIAKWTDKGWYESSLAGGQVPQNGDTVGDAGKKMEEEVWTRERAH